MGFLGGGGRRLGFGVKGKNRGRRRGFLRFGFHFHFVLRGLLLMFYLWGLIYSVFLVFSILCTRCIVFRYFKRLGIGGVFFFFFGLG